jgi:hypothetical protein
LVEGKKYEVTGTVTVTVTVTVTRREQRGKPAAPPGWGDKRGRGKPRKIVRSTGIGGDSQQKMERGRADDELRQIRSGGS